MKFRYRAEDFITIGYLGQEAHRIADHCNAMLDQAERRCAVVYGRIAHLPGEGYYGDEPIKSDTHTFLLWGPELLVRKERKP